ncbi:MAG: single-stranded DNA-binding protein [Candidatus Wallbacteria bacterium]
MKGLNKVFLAGTIGKDPEFSITKKGTPVARVSLATNEFIKSAVPGEAPKQLTQWHKISFFGTLAEFVNGYVKKGRDVLVEGSINYFEKQIENAAEKLPVKIASIKAKGITLLGKAENYISGGNNQTPIKSNDSNKNSKKGSQKAEYLYK